jgi:hypothetical protein
VRFVVDKAALGQIFLQVLWLSPVNIIPPKIHIHPHLHIALTRRTNGQNLETFEKEQ